jgi:hypothetical protein
MILREAVPEDRPALVRFMAALQDFERGLEPNRTPGAEMADEHLAVLEFWAAEHPGGGVLMAEVDGQLAGFTISGASTDRGGRGAVSGSRAHTDGDRRSGGERGGTASL